MPHQFKFHRVVEFADTDAASIMHFATFFRYMEQTEHTFLRSLGFSVHTKTSQGVISFPRVRAECDYVHPLRFENDVEIQLLVRERAQKSIRYDFVFYNVSSQPRIESARGSLTVICALIGPGSDDLQAVSIPESMVAKIEVAPRNDPQ